MSKRSRADPPPPEFFVDRNLGSEAVPSALEVHGFTVDRMADFYGDNLAEVDDSPWNREVTANGWVILTKDKRIRRYGPERDAVIESGARMFCLSTGKLTGSEMAERVVFHRHRMLQRCRRPGPFVYVLQRTRLELVI